MLQKIGFLPGFNKQITPTGAEAQWTGGENVRFRYGTPEKVGGWNQLGEIKLTGAARALHIIVKNTIPREICKQNTHLSVGRFKYIINIRKDLIYRNLTNGNNTKYHY
jgi:hypothetical protein